MSRGRRLKPHQAGEQNFITPAFPYCCAAKSLVSPFESSRIYSTHRMSFLSYFLDVSSLNLAAHFCTAFFLPSADQAGRGNDRRGAEQRPGGAQGSIQMRAGHMSVRSGLILISLIDQKSARGLRGFMQMIMLNAGLLVAWRWPALRGSSAGPSHGQARRRGWRTHRRHHDWHHGRSLNGSCPGGC